MSHPNFLTIGHRGARGYFPENTLAAFCEALLLGVDALEMDLVVSRDRQLVVSHEPWMNPLFCLRPDGSSIRSRREYNLFEMNYEEIRMFDCGKTPNPEFPLQKSLPSYKPLFSEVIQKTNAFAMKNALRPFLFLAEIKSEEPLDSISQPVPAEFVALLYEEMKKNSIMQQVCVQSFDPRILNEMHSLDPFLPMALLVETNDSFEENLDRLKFIPATYSPDFVLVTPQLVEQVHSFGMRIIPWTVNEPADMKQLMKMGVDGLISDYPDRVNEVKNNTLAF